MATRSQQTNFIHHQLKVRELFAKDERLSSFHVSLYFALFFEWNDNRFKTPFIINRSEIMNGAKIGNTNTYTKYLKELDLFGYIEYKPSYNPNIGSTINMFTFDNGCDNGTVKGSDKGVGKGTGKGSGKGNGMVVLPFNKENKTKETLQRNTKIVKGKSELKFAQAKSSNEIIDSFSAKLPTVQNEAKNIVPALDQIKSYFLEKESTSIEAEKFFNHFESNGWLVGGKTKMKNWQAAARNWILNGQKFKQETQQARFRNSNDHLHVNQDKDYSIPL